MKYQSDVLCPRKGGAEHVAGNIGELGALVCSSLGTSPYRASRSSLHSLWGSTVKTVRSTLQSIPHQSYPCSHIARRERKGLAAQPTVLCDPSIAEYPVEPFQTNRTLARIKRNQEPGPCTHQTQPGRRKTAPSNRDRTNEACRMHSRRTMTAQGRKLAHNLVTIAASEPVVCTPMSVRWSVREAAHARSRPFVNPSCS